MGDGNQAVTKLENLHKNMRPGSHHRMGQRVVGQKEAALSSIFKATFSSNAVGDLY